MSKYMLVGVIFFLVTNNCAGMGPGGPGNSFNTTVSVSSSDQSDDGSIISTSDDTLDGLQDSSSAPAIATTAQSVTSQQNQIQTPKIVKKLPISTSPIAVISAKTVSNTPNNESNSSGAQTLLGAETTGYSPSPVSSLSGSVTQPVNSFGSNPGGSQNYQTIGITPQPTTQQTPLKPIIGPDTFGTQLFTTLLSDLKSYNTLLQDFCSALEQYQNGQYYFMAFDQTGFGYLIIETCKTVALQYIKGRLQQFSTQFYASGTADNFINFSSSDAIKQAGQQQFLGELIQLDQFMQTLETMYQNLFSQLSVTGNRQQWKQQQENNYKAVFQQYLTARNQAIVDWFSELIKNLSQTFNGKNFALKNYTYEIIPNIQALYVYYNLYQQALSVVQQSPEDTVIEEQFAEVASFVGQLSLLCAGKLAQKYDVPAEQQQPNLFYNNWQQLIPVLISYGDTEPTGLVTNVPFTPINILQQTGFMQFFPQLQALNAQVESLITQCAFNQNQYNQLVSDIITYAFEPLNQMSVNKSDLVQQQKDAVAENSVKRILDYLEQAEAAFGLAQKINISTDKTAQESFYAMRESELTKILGYYKSAFTNYTNAQSAPLFEPGGSTAQSQGDYYYQAYQAFSSAAQAFELMGTESGQALAMYSKKLAAQLGIEQFVSLIKGYVGDAELITKYANSIAIDEPKKIYNALVAGNQLDEYTPELDKYITLFGPLLSNAVQRYQEELAFYISLNDPNDTDNQQAIQDLEVALQLLINLNDGFKNLYQKDSSGVISGANALMEQILGATTDDDIISLFMQAQQQYNQSLEAFKKVDILFKNNKKQLDPYRPLLELAQFFTLQGATKQGTFALFLQAHQARLYMTIGQKLLLEKKNPLSCLFFIYCAALYDQVGLYSFQDFMDIIKYSGNNSYFTEQVATVTQSIQKELYQRQPNAQKLKNLYEQMMLYILSGYVSKNDTKVIMKSLPVLEKYQQWLLRQTDTETEFYELQAACVAYKTYLLALSAGVKDAYQRYYVPAANLMPDLQTTVQNLYQVVQEASSKQLSQSEFKQTVTAFTTLMNLEKQIKYQQEQIGLWQILLQQPGANLLTFGTLPENLHKQLGYLYFQAAENQLKIEQNLFAAGKNYNSSNKQMTDLIIEWYNLAAIEYAIAQDQANYLRTVIGKTKAVAFQVYSSIIPVMHFNLSGIAINNPDNAQFSTCKNPVAVDKAIQNYDASLPLYLARFQEQIIPKKYDLSQAPETIAVDLYSDALQNQVGAGVDITEYVAEYQSQVATMMDSGVTVCGQTIKGSLKVVTSQGVSVLQMYNMPLTPLPRVQGETGTVMQLLSQGPLQLYGSGVEPINYAGQLLQPANDSTGLYLTRMAILNTYLAAAVSEGGKINAIKAAKEFTALQSLTAEEKLQASFGDYADSYQKINTEVVNILSIYQALGNYIQAFGTGQKVVNRLTAQQYLDWAQLTADFLVGAPTDTHYKSILKSVYEYGQGAVQYDVTPLTVTTQIFTLFGNLIVQASQQLCATPATPQTTQYPDTSTYPAPVSKVDFKVDFYDWKDALEYAMLGQHQISNFMDSYNPNSSNNSGVSYNAKTIYPLKMTLQNCYLQMAQANFYAGAYYLANFGYNAYQELTCLLQKSANKASMTDIIGLTNPTTAQNYWKVELVESGTPGYPKYQYPADGNYPLTDTEVDIYGNHNSVPFQGGKTFQLLQTTDASTVFQGVASIEQSSFQTILQSGQVGQDEQDFSNWASGSGVGNNNSNISTAYNLMNTYCLQAISNLMQVGNHLGALKKLFNIGEQSTKSVTPAQILTTIEIASLFSSPPAFQADFPAKIGEMIVPTIVVSSASKSAGSTETVSRFTQIKNYTNTSYSGEGGTWAPLSLASGTDLYPQTLHYWVSKDNPDFWLSIVVPAFNWVEYYGQALLRGETIRDSKKAQSYSVSQKFDVTIGWSELVAKNLGSAMQIKPNKIYYTTAFYNFIDTLMMWSDQLNQMTRNLYMDAYLPGNLNTKEGYVNADQIINEQLKTLSNSSFIAANQYVG